MSDEDQPVAAAAEQPPKPSRKLAIIILSTVMAAVLVVILMIVMQRQPTMKGEGDSVEGVELTVTAPKVGTQFTIDGVKAGKTPQAIKIRGRTRPIEIRGNNVIKIVTPDRDQVVNLVP